MTALRKSGTALQSQRLGGDTLVATLDRRATSTLGFAAAGFIRETRSARLLPMIEDLTRAFRKLLCLFGGIALLVGPVWAKPTARVYIVLIDGLDADWLDEHLTPTLWALAHGAKERATFYPEARAVLPSVTNTNHASVITGSYAEAHGILGNVVWDRAPEQPPEGSERAVYLEVETLFTVIERERPQLNTAVVFGKSRLVELFATVPKQQLAPDFSWGDLASESEPVDSRAGFTSDRRTMDEVLRVTALQRPDLLFTALADVDRTAHAFGPHSHELRRALLEADRQFGRLVHSLKSHHTWAETVVFVTADHGFASVEPDAAAGRPYPLILFGRELARAGFTEVMAIANGGMEGIFLNHAPRVTLDEQQGHRLAEIRSLALAQPEIAEAWYRLPNDADGGEAFTLASTHPDWRMNHPRAGDLVLVAKPQHHFNDPFRPHAAAYRGMHGAPQQARIPLLVTGGHPLVRSQVLGPGAPISTPANPDIGVTAAWLLDVRMPRTTSGKPVPADLAGRVLREAFH
jgi:hypothetical protein